MDDFNDVAPCAFVNYAQVRQELLSIDHRAFYGLASLGSNGKLQSPAALKGAARRMLRDLNVVRHKLPLSLAIDANVRGTLQIEVSYAERKIQAQINLMTLLFSPSPTIQKCEELYKSFLFVQEGQGRARRMTDRKIYGVISVLDHDALLAKPDLNIVDYDRVRAFMAQGVTDETKDGDSIWSKIVCAVEKSCAMTEEEKQVCLKLTSMAREDDELVQSLREKKPEEAAMAFASAKRARSLDLRCAEYVAVTGFHELLDLRLRADALNAAVTKAKLKVSGAAPR